MFLSFWCGPVFLGNIGSAARVLKNFGFHNLRFVEPPRNYKDSEARRMSVGAFDVLKGAEIFQSLSEALKDINLAIGTTSGQQRDLKLQSLPEIASEIVQTATTNRTALVFGDERNGLTRQELERCHKVITIPTDPSFPALNMAQSLAICAYELVRTSPEVKPAEASYPSGSADDELSGQIDTLLDTVNFTRKFNRHTVLSELRQLYQRARPTTREVDLLKGVLWRINQQLGGKQ